MNIKNNQRTRLSKMLLRNSLMDLLSKKGSIGKVSVRELCERAELNRSTFYAHYNEPKDLLLELEDELLNSAGEHLKKIGNEKDIGAHKYILSFLKYIRANDKPFRTLLIDSADPEFRSKFMKRSIIQFIRNFDMVFPKETEPYIFSYVLNGSTGVIVQWIRSSYSTDENTVCNLLFAINCRALNSLALYQDTELKTYI